MKLAVIFPGQGSQFAGMGGDLSREPAARETFDQANDVLGFDLLNACLDRNDELSAGAIAQPAILTQAVAAWRVVRTRSGVQPVATAGHSLGEIAALVCAGALAFDAAVGLAQERGRLMASCTPGKVAVVFGLPAADVAEVCAQVRSGTVCVGNRNAEAQCVITGEIPAVDEATAVLTERSAIVRPLRITAAAHSPLMEPIVGQFRELVDQAGIRDAAIPVVSSISGTARSSAAELAEGLCSQLTRTVDWPRAVEGLRHAGADTFLDTGPKTTLRDLVLLDAPTLTVFACDGSDTLGDVCDELAARSGAEAGDAPIARTAGVRSDSGALDSEQEIEALLRLMRAVVSAPTTAQLDDAAHESAVHRRYERLREMLDGARERDVREGSAGRGILETYAVLQAKGQSAAAARASITHALDGLVPPTVVDISLRATDG